jgi:aspartate racemase
VALKYIQMGAGKMTRKIVGVIGGMGPEATVDLYREIIRLTPARRDQEHISVLIYSNPEVTDRMKAILEGGEDPLPYLIHTATVLEKGGAGLLIVPCNTVHYYLPRLQEYVGIPILNMIQETCGIFLKNHPRGKTVGLLATTGTVRCGIYSNVFENAGVRVITPPEEEQDRVHSGIFNYVKVGNAGPEAHALFESAGRRLVESGAEAVILGCTEIPLAFDEGGVDYPTLNPTRILAQAAVDWALGRAA